jgi:CRP-like cAMP-binding protein
MPKESLIATLRAIVPLSDDEAALVRSTFTRVNFPARSYLVREGEISHSIFFILKGCARIGINCPTGDDVSCYFSQEGDFIAIYESFLTGKPAEYFVQTLEDCEMLVADRMGVENLFQKLENGHLLARRLTEGIFLSTIQRLTDFYMYTAEERFKNFLEENPSLVGRIPQNCLASYVGVKPQSLSRIKKRMMESMGT